jgi:hypothetical protein
VFEKSIVPLLSMSKSYPEIALVSVVRFTTFIVTLFHSLIDDDPVEIEGGV